MMSVLANLDKTYKLPEAPKEVIAAVQNQLCKVHLLDGAIDGIAGRKTLAAFAKFKELEYLEYPALLGPSTAIALAEATAVHAVPRDDGAPILTGHKAFLPKVGWVAAGDRIHLGGHFTWGEFTKNLSRVPQNQQVVENIVRLADYLEDVRQLFGKTSIIVNSGYRPPAINRSVGGASNSQHLYGAAADIVIGGIRPHEVYKRLNQWHGSKGGLGDGADFTHLDLRGYRARFGYG